jgi:hypothetical protein
MEMINESVWFQKAKVHSFVQNYSLLTNFLHNCQMDFTFEIIGEQLPNPIDHGCNKNL